MPFVRTNLSVNTSPEQQHSIVQGIHQALVDSIGMPQEELFNMVPLYSAGQFAFSRNFNGGDRSDRVVVIEITMRRGSSDAMKRTIYASIARSVETNADVKPTDMIIFMHENDYSDWSVGHRVFGMALVQQVGTPK